MAPRFFIPVAYPGANFVETFRSDTKVLPIPYDPRPYNEPDHCLHVTPIRSKTRPYQKGYHISQLGFKEDVYLIPLHRVKRPQVVLIYVDLRRTQGVIPFAGSNHLNFSEYRSVCGRYFDVGHRNQVEGVPTCEECIKKVSALNLTDPDSGFNWMPFSIQHYYHPREALKQARKEKEKQRRHERMPSLFDKLLSDHFDRAPVLKPKPRFDPETVDETLDYEHDDRRLKVETRAREGVKNRRR